MFLVAYKIFLCNVTRSISIYFMFSAFGVTSCFFPPLMVRRLFPNHCSLQFAIPSFSCINTAYCIILLSFLFLSLILFLLLTSDKRIKTVLKKPLCCSFISFSEVLLVSFHFVVLNTLMTFLVKGRKTNTY